MSFLNLHGHLCYVMFCSSKNNLRSVQKVLLTGGPVDRSYELVDTKI